MSICVVRTCLIARDASLNLYCRHPFQASKLKRTTLQMPSDIRNYFKNSNWNYTQRTRKRQHVNPIGNLCQDNYSLSRLFKPFIFTISVSGVSLTGAAIWEYENARSQAPRVLRWWEGAKSWWKGNQSWRERAESWRKSWWERAESWWEEVESWLGSNIPKYGSFRQHVNASWHNLSTAGKTFVPIYALNAIVFWAWNVRKWRPVMARYFTSSLASRALCWPMLLSVFSHFSVIHLGANMYCLHSFTEEAVRTLGKEQFLALYITSGMVASFTSYLYRAALKSPVKSLGASGAVMCVLAYFCCKDPHAHMTIIFLPQFSFEAGTGLKALICMDVLGCIYRRSFIDHAAHLGGSLFGVFWYLFGYENIWEKREPLVSAWQKIREHVI